MRDALTAMKKWVEKQGPNWHGAIHYNGPMRDDIGRWVCILTEGMCDRVKTSGKSPSEAFCDAVDLWMNEAVEKRV